MIEKRAPVRDTFAWQGPVLDRDLAAPPGSPSEGDRYIVGPSPTGAWSGHADDIAEYVSAAWEFYSPSEGWRVDVLDENTQLRYSGSAWVQAGDGGDAIGAIMFRQAPTFNGVIYAVGWYIQTDSAAALTSASPITAGDPGYHSHFVIDVSAASGLPFTIRFTGTSIDEASAALTPGDTEDISVTANGYYQTSKSWITAPQLSIIQASKSCTLDIYRTTYWDRGNTDFVVDGVRFEWEPSAISWEAELEIIHVLSDGSLYYIETITFDNSDSPPFAGNNEPGKYKRTDYNRSVAGSGKEGIIIRVTQTNISSFFIEVKLSG